MKIRNLRVNQNFSTDKCKLNRKKEDKYIPDKYKVSTYNDGCKKELIKNILQESSITTVNEKNTLEIDLEQTIEYKDDTIKKYSINIVKERTLTGEILSETKKIKKIN